MRVVRFRGSCPDGETCPTVHLSDRATFVLQGFAAHVPGLPKPGHVAVEMPLFLLPELASRPPSDAFWLTGVDTVIIVGPKVTDGEALDQLRLLDGEDAVEVPLSELPELSAEGA